MDKCPKCGDDYNIIIDELDSDINHEKQELRIAKYGACNACDHDWNYTEVYKIEFIDIEHGEGCEVQKGEEEDE